MKRVITLLSLAAICAAFSALGSGSVPLAKADQAFSPLTCGQNSGKYALSTGFNYVSSTQEWRWTWQQNCGVGGGTENEVQRLTLTGGIWQDLSDDFRTTSSSEANKTLTITRSTTGLGACNSSRTYRSGEWDGEPSHSVTYLNPDGHGGGNPGC